MQRRIWVLPISAAIIVALSTYKLTRTYPDRRQSSIQTELVVPAPRFRALDPNNQLVKFERYLGRHRIILVFFNGDRGIDQDAFLLKLRDHFPTIEASGSIVVALSTALPQENRRIFKAIGEFPFPVLSDPSFNTHRLWGRFDKSTNRPLTGAFFIDRAGNVQARNGLPAPLDDPEQAFRLATDGVIHPAE